jgi:hypothetical protein
VNLEFLGSSYVQLDSTDSAIANVVLPDGTKVPITAEQWATASIESHGNFGRSRIKVDIRVEMQAEGTPEVYRKHFTDAVVNRLRMQREENRKLRAGAEALGAELDQLKADARARAVVEVATEVSLRASGKGRP